MWPWRQHTRLLGTSSHLPHGHFTLVLLRTVLLLGACSMSFGRYGRAVSGAVSGRKTLHAAFYSCHQIYSVLTPRLGSSIQLIATLMVVSNHYYSAQADTHGCCPAGVAISFVRMFWAAARQGVAPVATYSLAALSVAMSLFLAYNMAAGGNPPRKDSHEAEELSEAEGGAAPGSTIT